PVILWLADLYLWLPDLPGAGHLGDPQAGVPFETGLMLRPDKVAAVAVLKGSGVERESIPAGLNFAFLHPVAFKAIIRFILKNILAPLPNIFRASRCKIDVPLALDTMNFGRTNVPAHWDELIAFPDRARLSTGQYGKLVCGAKLDTIVGMNLSSQVV